MTRYLATIRTATTYADRPIDAPNVDEALAGARQLARTGWRNLNFVAYRNRPCIERIEIRGEAGGVAAEWMDPDLPLREAAPEMLEALEAQTEAAQAVIDAWAEGDLAGAVRWLDATLAEARAAIATVKNAAP